MLDEDNWTVFIKFSKQFDLVSKMSFRPKSPNNINTVHHSMQQTFANNYLLNLNKIVCVCVGVISERDEKKR
ncbi:hypothetical protein BpHYR1_009721 [Brachionus plicatilis]|uniref:Uncharacterized protein n=1 Tax=Brachionus plicatilis TaxID=10195 RepID=A0A3M7Q9P5_BRAPC|nr:hypothetical protein BpHYR1_009721 [Brachionus plicatilis]